MEEASEPTIKPETEDQVWMDSDCEGEGPQHSVNLSENTIYLKDFPQIKDEPEQIFDCIKREIKDAVEVESEEWKEYEAGERDCFAGFTEGDLSEMSQISLTHTGLTEVYEKVKVESQGDAEFHDLDLETVSYAAEGKNVEPEEVWCQVTSEHKSSRLKSEGIFLPGCEKGHLVRVRPGKIIPVHQNLGNFEESEENLRKQFGCEREAVVKLARLRQDTAVPLQGINSEREPEHVMKATVVLDSNAKGLLQGLNIAEGSGRHLNNKNGSAELKESFSGRNIFGQLLAAKAFDKSYVNQHSQVNNKERQFSYNQGSCAVENKDDLNICIIENKERKSECDHCSYKINCRSNFIQHCLNHNKIKQFACDQCSYKTKNKKYLIQHCLTHSNIKKFACDQCSYKTNYRSCFTQHCLNHSTIKIYVCDQCPYKTNSKGHLTQHCLSHSSIKKFDCDQCSYKTHDRSAFTQHCLIHSNIKNIVCDKCSYRTNNKKHLAKHYLTHSSIKKFCCDQCSYKTNYKCSFKQHCLNHSNTKKYACDQCSYKTNHKSTFTRHCINHGNIKKFACDQCSYKTNYRRSFTQHCLNHSKIKQFACDQCSFKTNNKSHLARHCINHSSVKNFACDQCSYKTNRKDHFSQHYQIHKKHENLS